MKKVMWRLIPILILCYFAAFVDRTNVSFASLTMNKTLGFSSAVYGLGAGIFFWGYCLFLESAEFWVTSWRPVTFARSRQATAQ